MGLSGVRRSPGIPVETKCEGDGLGKYDVKPLTASWQVTDGPTKRQLFSSKKAMTFVHDREPAHTSKADQT